ncbi:MAG: DNA (cytosine-5-)-methyltransferase, partial [Hespellia sp.]|nr:DNA (cytosine-5-)-methyltransferase [Hespellia sp.]
MENNNLTLGSLFDGSGGFPLGGLISGITPLWASEVEPFPIRVTTKRLPQITHYGDVSKLNGAEVPPVDIITFGSPCQDMSVAGKRSGLDGERSSLFYQAVRIVKEMRCKTNGKYPRFVVWENVPGAFSSNKGEDFKAVLDSLCKIKSEDYAVPPLEKGKWGSAGNIMGEDFSLAWRVFDAQYWGVPQRRKRIYLVADFAGQCAGKILFESEGVSGYPPQGICPWQGTAGDFEGCTGTAGTVCLNDQGGNRMDVTEGMTCTLRAESKHPPLVFENHSQDTRYTGPLEQAPTVSSTYGTGGNNQPFVLETPKTLKIRSGCEGGGKGALVQDDLSATLGCNNDQTLFVPKCYGICAKDSNSMKSDNPHSGIYEADTSRCLDANGGNPACNQGGIVVVEGNGSRPSHKGDGYKESDVMYTLNTIEQHAVVYAIDRESYNCGANYARKMG